MVKGKKKMKEEKYMSRVKSLLIFSFFFLNFSMVLLFYLFSTKKADFLAINTLKLNSYFVDFIFKSTAKDMYTLEEVNDRMKYMFEIKEISGYCIETDGKIIYSLFDDQSNGIKFEEFDEDKVIYKRDTVFITNKIKILSLNDSGDALPWQSNGTELIIIKKFNILDEDMTKLITFSGRGKKNVALGDYSVKYNYNFLFMFLELVNMFAFYNLAFFLYVAITSFSRKAMRDSFENSLNKTIKTINEGLLKAKRELLNSDNDNTNDTERILFYTNKDVEFESVKNFDSVTENISLLLYAAERIACKKMQRTDELVKGIKKHIDSLKSRRDMVGGYYERVPNVDNDMVYEDNEVEYRFSSSVRQFDIGAGDGFLYHSSVDNEECKAIACMYDVNGHGVEVFGISSIFYNEVELHNFIESFRINKFSLKEVAINMVTKSEFTKSNIIEVLLLEFRFIAKELKILEFGKTYFVLIYEDGKIITQDDNLERKRFKAYECFADHDKEKIIKDILDADFENTTFTLEGIRCIISYSDGYPSSIDKNTGDCLGYANFEKLLIDVAKNNDYDGVKIIKQLNDFIDEYENPLHRGDDKSVAVVTVKNKTEVI